MGGGVAVLDYNNDGCMDVFFTNGAAIPSLKKTGPQFSNRLFRNNCNLTFTDVTLEAGVAGEGYSMAAAAADFDNDGFTDLFVAGVDRNILYRNLGNGNFKDVSATMGPGITERYSSRGAAFGDYDNDGSMDILILNMNDRPSLLHNVGGNKQNWIKLKLIGTRCNRTAIGARARVITGKHIQMAEVQSGASVMSQNDLRLHFGLGSSRTVDLIEVKWPTTQKIERFEKLKANQILTIREGEGIVPARSPA